MVTTAMVIDLVMDSGCRVAPEHQGVYVDVSLQGKFTKKKV